MPSTNPLQELKAKYQPTNATNTLTSALSNSSGGRYSPTIINLKQKVIREIQSNPIPVIDRSKLDSLKSKLKQKYNYPTVTSELITQARLVENKTQIEPRLLNYSTLNLPAELVYTSPMFKGSILYNPIFNSYFKLQLAVSMAILAILVFGSGLLATNWSNNQFQVANADENSILSKSNNNFNVYKSWVESSNNGIYSKPEEDIDNDKLSNFEEFLIRSNPITPYSCNAKITDIENLNNLINPATCKAIDLNNPEEINRFRQVIAIPSIDIEVEPNIDIKPDPKVLPRSEKPTKSNLKTQESKEKQEIKVEITSPKKETQKVEVKEFTMLD
jgi:hypothetical protein